MIERSISLKLKKIFEQYPVLTLTGPRQSGKTTLVRNLFPDLPCFNLEDPQTLRFATDDPQSFLRQVPEGVIIDEIQRAPDLPSYIQVIVDQFPKKNGRFIITGSQQLEVIDAVNQSLAGRTAIAKLLPLSVEELINAKLIKPDLNSLNSLIYKGFYPRIYDQKLEAHEAYSFYIATYVERDLRNIRAIQDLSQFQKFLRICAGHIGQLTNFSLLGNEIGIDHKSATQWFSILEASYICFRLAPHFHNFKKRVTKSSKLYFYDVGLACYLLGIEDEKQLNTHPLRGALFENFVISEFFKKRCNQIKDSNLYFFRDHTGHEVDLILDYGQAVWPIEIKAGQTINSDFFTGLKFYASLGANLHKKPLLIYGGDSTQERSDISVIPWWQMIKLEI